MLAGGEDSDSDGEVVGGAFFAEAGGGEVNGEALGGVKFEVAIFEGGGDTVAGFADGGVGEADDVEAGLSSADVYFYLDDFGVESCDGTAKDFG